MGESDAVDIEDNAGKTRRNLMMMSTGILAVWALGIPLDGKLVGAVNLNQVEPWRAWICATVVLFYFWLRFSLAPKAAEQRAEYKLKKQTDLLGAVGSHVVNEYANWRITRSRSRTVTFDPEIPPNRPDAEAYFVHIDNYTIPFKKGTARFLRKPPVGSPVPFIPIEGNPTTTFEIADWFPKWLWLKLHVQRLWRLTWLGTELSLPHFLAAGALVICVSKLFKNESPLAPFVCQLLTA